MSSPATADGVTALGYKLSDARSEILVGQGHIIKQAGDNTSAILRDANNNTAFTNANVSRTGADGINETVRTAERLSGQANTIAWNEMNLQDAGFHAQSAQIERINDAQSAFSDRAAKFNAQMTTDSFARLSAQGENGFARELDATTNGTRQTVQSEIGVTRTLYDGFRDSSATAAANYVGMTQQNFMTKEAVANYGNRAADQTASVLATLTAQHSAQTRDFNVLGRDLATQAANNAAAMQLESAKNAAAISLEAAKNAAALGLDAARNAAAAQVQAALNAKDIAEKVALGSKESLLQGALLAKEGLLENSKWFALAEKTAMTNKLDSDAKMAACCCEIKEAVIGTANATQSLIQTNESSRVRDALAATVAENSILRLRREEQRPYPVPYPFPYRSESPRRRGDSPPRR